MSHTLAEVYVVKMNDGSSKYSVLFIYGGRSSEIMRLTCDSLTHAGILAGALNQVSRIS